MFGKSKPPGPEDARPAAAEPQRAPSRPGKPGLWTPEPPRRSGAYALPGMRQADQRKAGEQSSRPERQLVVGREISLAGEIKACEYLVVEGKVEADLADCKLLEIAVSGLYRGAASVDQADISGHFDGELTVKGTLILRSTGRVSGKLRYSEMEIERGGKVSGSLKDIPPEKPEQPAEPEAAPDKKPAPKASAATKAAGPARRAGGPAT